MKKIECYLREEDAERLCQELVSSGINGVTTYQVQGYGRQRGVSGQRLPKTKVEILALEVELEEVLRIITSLTYSGNFGDGKIAVIDLVDAIRVRTGEHGPKALM